MMTWRSKVLQTQCTKVMITVLVKYKIVEQITIYKQALKNVMS